MRFWATRRPRRWPGKAKWEWKDAEKAGTLPADINSLPAQGEFDIQARAQEIIANIKARDEKSENSPEITALNVRIKELSKKITSDETSSREAKSMRIELKKLRDQKAKIQTRDIIGLR